MNKSESRPPSLPDKIEQWSKIVATIAIPLILALIGYFVNASLQNQTVSQKYVEMAIKIIQEPPDSEQNRLRKWAVDLLEKSSPIGLSRDLKDELLKGDISLPKLGEIQEIKSKIILKPLKRLENDFFRDFPKNPKEAEEIIDYTLKYINDMQIVFPDDPYLEISLGYTYKNHAMVLGKLGRTDECKESLEKSEKVFNGILDNNQRDAGAWNGLGNIAILRNKPQQALEHIKKALEINPYYRAAEYDKAIAERMLKGVLKRKECQKSEEG